MFRTLPSTFRLQFALAGVALATVALAPPADGPVLLVPIASDAGTAIRIATAHGARLIGPAPGGSLLIWGDAATWRPLLAAGVLPLAAPFSACGKSSA
jgi:hypothetical protein